MCRFMPGIISLYDLFKVSDAPFESRFFLVREQGGGLFLKAGVLGAE